MVTWKSAYDVNEIHYVLEDVLKTSPYLFLHLQKTTTKQKTSMLMDWGTTKKYTGIPYHTYNLD